MRLVFIRLSKPLYISFEQVNSLVQNIIHVIRKRLKEKKLKRHDFMNT